MPKKLGYSLLAVTAGVLIFVTAAILLARTPPLETLPSPNGYDDLLGASKTVTHQLDDVDTLDLAGLRLLIETNAERLQLARVGLGRRWEVPTDSIIANFGSITTDLVGLKMLAKLFFAEGRLKELENRPGDAARSWYPNISSKCQPIRLVTVLWSIVLRERIGFCIASGLTGWTMAVSPLAGALQESISSASKRNRR